MKVVILRTCLLSIETIHIFFCVIANDLNLQQKNKRKLVTTKYAAKPLKNHAAFEHLEF